MYHTMRVKKPHTLRSLLSPPPPTRQRYSINPRVLSPSGDKLAKRPIGQILNRQTADRGVPVDKPGYARVGAESLVDLGFRAHALEPVFQWGIVWGWGGCFYDIA